jgi:hypothetical protein
MYSSKNRKIALLIMLEIASVLMAGRYEADRVNPSNNNKYTPQCLFDGIVSLQPHLPSNVFFIQ